LKKADAFIAAPLYYILILPGIITVFFQYCVYDVVCVSVARISGNTFLLFLFYLEECPDE